MNSNQINLRRLYREIGAGGFSHVDGTVEFYQRINALISPEMIVLDIGAGRGEQLMRDDAPYRTGLCRLQGKVKRLVAADVDQAVLSNPLVDEAHVIDPDRPLPFSDSTFDLVYSDWVLEHVADPTHFVGEVERVLKPGGWFCARTPNRWGMTGIAVNLIPNRMHVGFLKYLQQDRLAIDVFPTFYRMNTMGKLHRLFSYDRWDNFSYRSNSEPPYVQRSLFLMRLIRYFWRISPPFFHTNMYVFVRRKD